MKLMKKKLKLGSKFIPVSKSLITKKDCDSVYKVLKKGWISSEGPEVKKFEENFSSKEDFCLFLASFFFH